MAAAEEEKLREGRDVQSAGEGEKGGVERRKPRLTAGTGGGTAPATYQKLKVRAAHTTAAAAACDGAEITGPSCREGLRRTGEGGRMWAEETRKSRRGERVGGGGKAALESASECESGEGSAHSPARACRPSEATKKPARADRLLLGRGRRGGGNLVSKGGGREGGGGVRLRAGRLRRAEWVVVLFGALSERMTAHQSGRASRGPAAGDGLAASKRLEMGRQANNGSTRRGHSQS